MVDDDDLVVVDVDVFAKGEEDVVDLGVVVTGAPGDRNAADVKGCASRCNALRRVTTYLLRICGSRFVAA